MLESLTWCETGVEAMLVEPEIIEIEVVAVGVNFKVCEGFIFSLFFLLSWKCVEMGS